MLTYLFLKYLIAHIKYCKILNNVYRDENLLVNLTSLFKVQFKKDWIGRIYAVFNPHIQEGVFNQNNQIYEYTENGLVNDAYVEAYILNQLNVAKLFIKANNLFDLLTYRLKRLDDNDNYLFIMEPITWEDCKKYTKLYSILLTTILIFGSIFIYLYK
jgi:hypothetical protein